MHAHGTGFASPLNYRINLSGRAVTAAEAQALPEPGNDKVPLIWIIHSEQEDGKR